MAQIQTGYDLTVIKDHELYKSLGFTSFAIYVDTPIMEENGAKSYRFNFDSREANRRIKHANSYKLLEAYKAEKHLSLPLPENAFQMRPIAKLPFAQQAPYYFKAIEHANKCSVTPTAEFLEVFMRNGFKSEREAPAISDELLADVILPGAEDEPIQKRFNRDALVTLDRIEKFSEENVFPTEAAKAIREGFFKIDDDDLALWSQFPDEDFKAIGRMLFRLPDKVTFTTARRFNAKCKDPEFLDRIVLYAISQGSHVIRNHNGFQIQIRPVPAPSSE